MQRYRDRLNGMMRAYNGREVSPEEAMSQHRLKEEALTRPRRERIVFSSEQQVPLSWVRYGAFEERKALWQGPC